MNKKIFVGSEKVRLIQGVKNPGEKNILTRENWPYSRWNITESLLYKVCCGNIIPSSDFRNWWFSITMHCSSHSMGKKFPRHCVGISFPRHYMGRKFPQNGYGIKFPPTIHWNCILFIILLPGVMFFGNSPWKYVTHMLDEKEIS